MRRRDFANKVRGIRDSMIIDIQELSADKPNLLNNIKVIKELTTILRELDRIIDQQEEDEEEEVELDHFYEKIKDRSVIRIPSGKTKKEKNNPLTDEEDEAE